MLGPLIDTPGSSPAILSLFSKATPMSGKRPSWPIIKTKLVNKFYSKM